MPVQRSGSKTKRRVCSDCEDRPTCKRLCPDMVRELKEVEVPLCEVKMADLNGRFSGNEIAKDYKEIISDIVSRAGQGNIPTVEKMVMLGAAGGISTREIASALGIGRQRVRNILKDFRD